MQIIGILGGVASGKSVVADMFQRLGAVRLDADRAGHAVLERAEVRRQLLERWGNDLLADDGSLNRRAIATRVFGNGDETKRELQFLERLTHPEIGRQLTKEIDEASAAGHPAAVLDAAVMMKAGWDRLCTVLVFVDVPRAERRRRALSRGWTVDQFESREAAQSPIATKRQRADRIIDNSGTLEETLEQVKLVWSSLALDQS